MTTLDPHKLDYLTPPPRPPKHRRTDVAVKFVVAALFAAALLYAILFWYFNTHGT